VQTARCTKQNTSLFLLLAIFAKIPWRGFAVWPESMSGRAESGPFRTIGQWLANIDIIFFLFFIFLYLFCPE
jgi:hypothetical protein